MKALDRYKALRCLDEKYPRKRETINGKPLNKARMNRIVCEYIDRLVPSNFDRVAYFRLTFLSIAIFMRTTLEPYGPTMQACIVLAWKILIDPLYTPPRISTEDQIKTLENLEFKIFYPCLYDYLINSMDRHGIEKNDEIMNRMMKYAIEYSCDKEKSKMPDWELADAIVADEILNKDFACQNDEPNKAELVDDIEFSVVKNIGSGTFGSVDEVRVLKNVDEKYVSKTFKNGLKDDALTEIGLLMNMKNPNVVFIEYLNVSDKSVSIFMKKYEGDLDTYIQTKKLNQEGIKNIMRGILKGLEYIHSQMIIHRDLKPKNILINDSDELCIADFGQSQYAPGAYQLTDWEFCTEQYRAPEISEIFKNRVYTSSFDMWSVGCIFFELITNEMLFGSVDGLNYNNPYVFTLFKILGTPVIDKNSIREGVDIPFYKGYSLNAIIKLYNSDVDPDCVDLIGKLFKFNPAERLTASQALEHPFLK
jgi:hypothetical protein